MSPQRLAKFPALFEECQKLVAVFAPAAMVAEAAFKTFIYIAFHTVPVLVIRASLTDLAGCPCVPAAHAVGEPIRALFAFVSAVGDEVVHLALLALKVFR